MKIKDYLRSHFLVTDGAMGTYYTQRYPMGEDIVERENVKHPNRIKELHLEYLRAGARLIRTNSFAANSYFFTDPKERREVVRRSYEIAQEAVQEFRQEDRTGAPRAAGPLPDDIYVVANLGTVFSTKVIGTERVLEEYQETIDVFLEAGAENFLFESQADTALLQELSIYIKVQRPDAYVMATFSIDKTGYTKAGIRLERLIQQLHEIPELDAYGLNCGMDALHMLRKLQEVSLYDARPLLALPNAGYPYVLRGQAIYPKNVPYFVEHEMQMLSLGVDMIGGCCGTTPEYIAKLQEALDLNKPNKAKKHIVEYQPMQEKRTLSAFWRKLQEGEVPFIVELDPPFDTHTEKVQKGAIMLKEHQVDLLTLSDSPMGRTRMDALQLAGKLQREVGIQVMPHMTCRDRNLIALRSGMLGSYANGIRHYLVVTGDPVPVQDRNRITAVFDYNSIHFMHLMKEMNTEFFASDTVVYGGALNYHGKNPDAIVHRMKLKMAEGCGYFLTQPIYSAEDVERICYLKEQTGAKICCGIMPLVSYKNAIFIANEMPGIHVPQKVVSAYWPGMSREEAQAVAVKLSVTTAKQLKGIADGYYFMTPFNRVALICQIIENIRKEVL